MLYLIIMICEHKIGQSRTFRSNVEYLVFTKGSGNIKAPPEPTEEGHK